MIGAGMMVLGIVINVIAPDNPYEQAFEDIGISIGLKIGQILAGS